MEEKAVVQAIIIISAIFLLVGVYLIVYILYFNKRKTALIREKQILEEQFQLQLRQSQVEVQEQTFMQIAKELHDNVGQLLSTTKMLIGVTEIKMGTVPDTLSTANATLTKAIHEIRFLSRSLDKEWLSQFSFMDNLSNEIGRIKAGGVIAASITGNTEIQMEPGEQIILFRIVQEAIQNAIRHAKPSKLNVDISGVDQSLLVKVTNNGEPLPETFQGMGTNNMKQRVKLFGGNIEWHSNSEGTIVTITIPNKILYEDKDRISR